MAKLIAQISTHKVVKENGKFVLYMKAMKKKDFDADFIAMFPDMFKERKIRVIEHEDDVECILDSLAETNRCNLAEANGEF